MKFTVKDHNGRPHKVTELGTWFSIDTPDRVIDVLEDARVRLVPVRVFYGDRQTGRDWMEEYDVCGRVSRSNGGIKIPILLYSSRSMGGGSLLTNCILKIISREKRILYQAENYQLPMLFLVRVGEGVHAVHRIMTANKKGECVARFESNASAQRWMNFMQGSRFRP